MFQLLFAVLSAVTNAGPGLKLREKLAQLLMDPEYDEMKNEISQEDNRWQMIVPHNSRQGMLLKNKSPSPRFKSPKNSLPIFDIMKTSESEETFESVKNTKTTTSTTEAPSIERNIVLVGMAPLKALMNRIMEIWSG